MECSRGTEKVESRLCAFEYWSLPFADSTLCEHLHYGIVDGTWPVEVECFFDLLFSRMYRGTRGSIASVNERKRNESREVMEIVTVGLHSRNEPCNVRDMVFCGEGKSNRNRGRLLRTRFIRALLLLEFRRHRATTKAATGRLNAEPLFPVCSWCFCLFETFESCCWAKRRSSLTCIFYQTLGS